MLQLRRTLFRCKWAIFYAFCALHEWLTDFDSPALHSSARRQALTRFKMHAMSPTMTEGVISQWKKQEGESYSAGDVLLEVVRSSYYLHTFYHLLMIPATYRKQTRQPSTSKRQTTAFSRKLLLSLFSLRRVPRVPESRRLLRYTQVADGTKGIPVGGPIAIIGEPGDDLSGAADLAKEAASAPPPAKAEQKSEPAPAPKASEPAPKKDKPAPSTKKDELQVSQRIFATPIAKKIALERGIPLAQVKGSGPEGRILREDVEKFKPSAFAAPSGPTATTVDYIDIPVSNMRRVIGQRLTQSKQELPHYYATVDIDMGKVAKLREVFNARLKDKEGAVKISVNDFIMKAVSLAMADVPEANSAWLGETIRQYVNSTCTVGCLVNGYFDRYKKVDISMAVSTPTGLITPIITDVASKGLASIAAESKSLAKKARDGKLAPHEYQVCPYSLPSNIPDSPSPT